jgi:hypothetical protein
LADASQVRVWTGGATCGSPPVINFTGLAHRCIIAP